MHIERSNEYTDNFKNEIVFGVGFFNSSFVSYDYDKKTVTLGGVNSDSDSASQRCRGNHKVWT